MAELCEILCLLLLDHLCESICVIYVFFSLQYNRIPRISLIRRRELTNEGLIILIKVSLGRKILVNFEKDTCFRLASFGLSVPVKHLKPDSILSTKVDCLYCHTQ